jgi:hypothetical protein
VDLGARRSVSTDEFELRLTASAPSRIFGISFESPYGFHADNVAMRGASGMIFSKMNDEQFSASLEREGYDLIIMQFGGNAVPYLRMKRMRADSRVP